VMEVLLRKIARSSLLFSSIAGVSPITRAQDKRKFIYLVNCIRFS
jgi:hypothetical protein